MIKIERKALILSQIAGGASKKSMGGDIPSPTVTTTNTNTVSTLVTVNGKEIVNQTNTF